MVIHFIRSESFAQQSQRIDTFSKVCFALRKIGNSGKMPASVLKLRRNV